MLGPDTSGSSAWISCSERACSPPRQDIDGALSDRKSRRFARETADLPVAPRFRCEIRKIFTGPRVASPRTRRVRLVRSAALARALCSRPHLRPTETRHATLAMSAPEHHRESLDLSDEEINRAHAGSRRNSRASDAPLPEHQTAGQSFPLSGYLFQILIRRINITLNL